MERQEQRHLERTRELQAPSCSVYLFCIALPGLYRFIINQQSSYVNTFLSSVSCFSKETEFEERVVEKSLIYSQEVRSTSNNMDFALGSIQWGHLEGLMPSLGGQYQN